LPGIEWGISTFQRHREKKRVSQGSTDRGSVYKSEGIFTTTKKTVLTGGEEGTSDQTAEGKKKGGLLKNVLGH